MTRAAPFREKLLLLWRWGRPCHREFYQTETELGLVTPSRNEAAALDALHDITSVLTAHHALHHVCDGTLLGIVREGGFIADDNDIDFRVDRSALTDDLVLALQTAGFTLFKRSSVKGHLASIGLARDGIAVDLYGTDFSAGAAVFHIIYKDGYLTYCVPFHGVEERVFRNLSLSVPKRAEADLIACYGATWQTPISAWDGVFDHRALLCCTGGLKTLFSAAYKFQDARSPNGKPLTGWSALRGALRAIFWLRLRAPET